MRQRTLDKDGMERNEQRGEEAVKEGDQGWSSHYRNGLGGGNTQKEATGHDHGRRDDFP